MNGEFKVGDRVRSKVTGLPGTITDILDWNMALIVCNRTLLCCDLDYWEKTK